MLRLLTEYIENCLQARDNTEFISVEKFNIDAFNSLQQDGIMCSYTQPPILKNIEYVNIGPVYISRKIDRSLHWLNPTTNEFEWTDSRDPLYRRMIPPPEETVDHSFLIQSIIETVDPLKTGVYIEYGVRDAKILNYISQYVKMAYGVDINSTNPVRDNVLFTQCKTDFFSQVFLPNIKYNFAFIDADHKFESVFKDFQYIFKYITKGGYIFLHDTYPCNEFYLNVNGCADCYRTPIEIKKHYTQHELEILTLPLHPGFTIIRKLT